VSTKETAELRKRKLIAPQTTKLFKITKDAKCVASTAERVVQVKELTEEFVKSGK
jgi:hypothetical protein